MAAHVRFWAFWLRKLNRSLFRKVNFLKSALQGVWTEKSHASGFQNSVSLGITLCVCTTLFDFVRLVFVLWERHWIMCTKMAALYQNSTLEDCAMRPTSDLILVQKQHDSIWEIGHTFTRRPQQSQGSVPYSSSSVYATVVLRKFISCFFCPFCFSFLTVFVDLALTANWLIFYFRCFKSLYKAWKFESAR